MNISEWANFNGMTPDEFKNEIASTMAAVGGMELDGEDNTDKAEGVAFNVEDSDYKYKVIVTRKAL